MKYTEYRNINDFLNKTEEILIANEAVNGLMYGIAEVLKKDFNYYGDDPLLATVESESVIELVVMMTPPYKIQIIAAGKNHQESLEILSRNVFDRGWKVPAVIAENKISELFSKIWCKLTDQNYKLVMNCRIYELKKVEDVPVPAGRFRIATMDDYDLSVKWTKAFQVDCFGDEEATEETRMLEDKIKSGALYIWEDGGKPVSMTARVRPTPNGECVNLVYTPPEHRKKGYATGLVAEVSREILRRGKKFCTLFTDLSNPTSNSIYQKIGYKPVADVCDYLFE